MMRLNETHISNAHFPILSFFQSVMLHLCALTISILLMNGKIALAQQQPEPQADNTQSSAQTKIDETQSLIDNQVIERDLAGGEMHAYKMDLEVKQFVQLIVEQKGIDVVVTLFDADGKKLVERNAANGTQGAERLSIITGTAGGYRVEVKSLEKQAASGRYEIKIAEQRDVKAGDHDRFAASRARVEAQQLISKQTAESQRQALAKYEEALSLLRGIGDQQEEAKVLNAIGLIHSSLGNHERALEYYQQALPIVRAIGLPGKKAALLNNMGVIYARLGEPQKALESYSQALLQYRAVGNRKGEATTLNSMGTVYNNLGKLQQALESYHQAISLQRAVGDRLGEAWTLNGIGSTYGDLNEPQLALECLQKSLSLMRAAGERRGEALTLRNIGVVYAYLSQSQKSLEYYQQALSIYQAVGNRSTLR